MNRCNYCGSTNIKVHFGTVYTSIPAKLKYECKDCGCIGYINVDDVDRSEFNSEGYQKYPRPEVNLNSNLNRETIDKTEPTKGTGGLTGWICPKCGRCYSPYTSMCPHCNTDKDITWKITC